MTGTTTLLEAHELYRFYHAGDEETLALRGVSIALVAGELVAASGPSGSGKSTLLACLAGLDEPDGGFVRVAGRMITRRSEAERSAVRAECIGMLFQSGNLVDHLSVRENVLLAQRMARRAESRSIESILESVGLGDRSHAMPAELSGGEASRAGLAVALANAPDVVLADEPTGELDRSTADGIIDLLRAHTAGGATALIVTHDPAVAARCDREIRLSDGRIL